MFAQRRGLANPSTATDSEARDANLSLIQKKRKQNIESQLEEKRELLKQFTNARGIGMKGQTVPQRDIDMLQEQIQSLESQLATFNRPAVGLGNSQFTGMNSPSGLPTSGATGACTPLSSGRTTQHVGASSIAVSLQGPAQNVAPSIEYSASSCGKSSKRDEVWHRKYQAWMDRVTRSQQTPAEPFVLRGVGNNGTQPFPISQSGPSEVSQRNVPVVHGRRATPPAEKQPEQSAKAPFVAQPSCMRQDSAPQHGRRSSQQSTRPW